MKRLLTSAVLAAALVAPALQAQGPAGTFGALPGVTFGGSGIPNSAVMIGGANGVVLGITATPRYSSPALGNNGAGVFYAQAGESAPGLSLWNFSFYVGGTARDRHTYRLLYDFDPTFGNAGHGEIFTLSLMGLGYNNSQNLGFAGLATDVPLFVSAPDYPSFNPNSAGSYTFALEQYNFFGTKLATVGMEVIVASTATVPEPAPAALLLVGMVGLVAVRVRSVAGARSR